MFLNDNLKLFSGSGNAELTRAVCKYLEIPLGGADIERFADGEKVIRIEDDVRGRDCFVLQSTCRPVDEHLVELLIYLDCLRRASAKRITAVVPYFGYARQDRKDEGRVPITAKLVANLITAAGADRVLAIDLHAAQVQGFFDIPVDHLSGELVLSRYFRDKKIGNLTIVSPDVGNMKIASRYADRLSGDLAIVHKKRVSGSEAIAQEIIGDVKGRNIVMCDDIIATAGTICSAAKLVKDRGAEKIYIGATHGVFAGQALERLREAPIDEIVVTDTIPLTHEARDRGDIKVLTVSSMLGEAIKRIHRNESVSNLFTEY
ncbi:MAG: ribose-phosphate diphosphokinase [Phycisphaerae bacterium]|nr:ribose-phosphate pyrophosphokinase [Phycisphaerae bacterium]NIW70721.1 ribose-phosphate diphosphokinase [candidate division KSB1 bacterium]NIP51256.1 ribose-phosphate pyrophosphokinase [Phycisphaerae bacterium]NIS50459.1 ribose-phosphate pyrophosphokinase [Phycisphaerae bacterium]NIU08199.1 ribose-phosphate pyrophosphokinase [Phycisphaerae bacterium]